MFYGGKGGVGKTTCAAARAVREALAGARVLVVSTDPAHSLGDALGVKLSSRPTTVRLDGRRTSKLDAVELDAPRAFARWLRQHRAALGDILEHGTWLGRADVEALLDFPVPGIDELMGLLEIARIASARHYDLTVVDTAPTGHTLRLLAAPATVTAIARVLDALQAEHRYVRRQLARIGGQEAADRLIALVAAQAAEVRALLTDGSRAAFHWVTLPEALSIAESADALCALTTSGIRVAEITVNRVLLPGRRGLRPCPVCDRRRVEQRDASVEIRRTIGRERITRLVPDRVREPRGVRALARVASRSVDGAVLMAPELPEGRREGPCVLSLPRGAATVGPEDLDAFRGARLIFIGGKGGVGKTTVAAAVAIRLARAAPNRQVLLLSTDPAHSLSDVFAAPVGDAPGRVPRAPANLRVRELDAARALGEKLTALESALVEVGPALRADGIAADAAIGRFVELAPAGIDELFGMLSVFDVWSSGGILVMDMAPTGHALRLLEMPDTAAVWVKGLLRLLLKYRSLVRPGRLAAELVDASRSVRELQARLRDRKLSRFIVVSRAAAVPSAETGRLLDRLRRLKLSVPAVVINARTLSPGACLRCRAAAAAERDELAGFRRKARGSRCVIIQTPLATPPPRGVSALDGWAGSWVRSGSDG